MGEREEGTTSGHQSPTYSVTDAWAPCQAALMVPKQPGPELHGQAIIAFYCTVACCPDPLRLCAVPEPLP